MGTKERRKPQKPFSTLARLLRWLIGSSYLLVALLGLALLGEIARPLTTSKAGLPSGDPTTLIPIGLWTIIGIGILTRHAWGPGLAVILPLVTAYLAGHFGDGPFWFVAGSHSAWIVGERVPLQLILEPLVASGARTPLTAPAN